MKANQMLRSQRLSRRSLSEDHRAVSAILGGILFSAILVSAVVTYRVNYVPEIEKGKEANKAQELLDQMGTFRGSLDRLLLNQTFATVVTPIRLSTSSGLSVGGVSSLPDQLSFGQTEIEVNVGSPTFRLIKVNDKFQTGTAEEWSSAGTGTTPIDDASEILNFRIRIHDVTKKDDGKSVILRIYDANGDAAGLATVYIQKGEKDETLIKVQTVDADNNVLFDQGEEFRLKGKSGLETYWIDLMDTQYRFGSLLAEAEPPFDVTMDDDGLQAEYTVTYQTGTGGGGVVVGGSGPVETNYAKKYAGGVLRIDSRNQFYSNQAIIVENGAVILAQGNSAVFRIPPDIRVTSVGGNALFQANIPSLVGSPAAIGGADAAVLRANIERPSQVLGEGPQVDLNITSGFPALYRDHIDQQMRAAGLLSSGCTPSPGPLCNYRLVLGPQSVRVIIYGFTVVDVDPLKPTYDVSLEIRQATIRLAVDL